MICKNCGADIGNNGKCMYCDTVYFEEFQIQAVPTQKEAPKQENKPKGKSGKTRAKLTFPTKIALFIWSLCCLFVLPELETIGYYQYIYVVIMGFLFYGGITQLISARYIKQHQPDQGKIVRPRAKITLPTKVVVTIWLLGCIFILPQAKTNMSQFQCVIIAIFGAFFYGGITQLISSQSKKKHISTRPEQTTQTQTHIADLSPKPYEYMDALEFKFFCCDILEKHGFIGISVTKTPENHGIDIIAFKNGIKYGIQCKCSSYSIGIAAVQKALAGKTFFECQAAAILTNQYFSQNAKELAERTDIMLWDRNRLNKFIERQ